MTCFLRDRVIMFWTMMFPLLLSTMFVMALSNINKADVFVSARVAVVDNEAYRNNESFRKALAQASADGGEGKPLLSVVTVSEDEAIKLLEEGKADGIIIAKDNAENDVSLIVKNSGLSSSIIKSFLDRYRQISASYASVFELNPQLLANPGSLKDFSADTDYLAEVLPGKGKADNTVTYYYALLAMTSLYGSFWGMRVVTETQADQSARAMRVNIAPVHKMKALLSGILAAWIIQFTELIILLLYMRFVLKVSFGSRAGYILLTCLAGSLAGVTMGTLVSAVVRKSESLKVGVLISLSIVMSGLSGLYYAPMKYMVTSAVPLLACINPANLIADALYALYYYDTLGRFAVNISLLLAFSALFSLLTYLCVRSERYAGIPGIQEDN